MLCCVVGGERVYFSEAPEEVEQVTRAVGLQDKVHGQTPGLAAQHPHQPLALAAAHLGVEQNPLGKLPLVTRAGAACVDMVENERYVTKKKQPCDAAFPFSP